MITVNGPFIVALIIIVFLIVIKWIEWYLFQNGALQTAYEEDAERKLQNKIITFGKRLKNLLFFGKADIRRPWYIGIPSGILVGANTWIVNAFDLNVYRSLCYIALIVLFIVPFDLFIMLKVNKDYFSRDDRKRRYIKTQLAQFGLCMIVLIIVIGGLMLHYHIKGQNEIRLTENIDWAIKPSFEGLYPQFTEGLAPVKKHNVYGFIDKKGNTAISCRYTEVGNFYEGLAAVKKDGRWGYIDQEGKQIIPFQYEAAGDFGDGLAPVQKNDIWMVIDKKGVVQFKADYTFIGQFHEGVAEVDIKYKHTDNWTQCNLVDTEGNLLFKRTYDFRADFKEGYILVYDYDTGKVCFLDKNEKKVIPLDFVEAGSFSNGYAAVWLDDAGFALIDHEGNIIRGLSEEEYNNYNFYYEGIMEYSVGVWKPTPFGKDDRKYGFKDFNGNVIIPALFQNVTWASDGMIGLEVNGLWGFVENPLPEAARRIDPELWKEDKTQIATAEGLPIYAGELESLAYTIRENNPELSGIPAYKKAFEQLKAQKAFEKYGKNIEPEKIQYQIGNSYYRVLLLEKLVIDD